mmetsp:Transcript_60826/g.139060  ORF Transcript_60826/g.139060 Transcript_60826/m.139060 type:complete len:265 (-) Transcript_60826:395-1189(-)
MSACSVTASSVFFCLGLDRPGAGEVGVGERAHHVDPLVREKLEEADEQLDRRIARVWELLLEIHRLLVRELLPEVRFHVRPRVQRGNLLFGGSAQDREDRVELVRCVLEAGVGGGGEREARAAREEGAARAALDVLVQVQQLREDAPDRPVVDRLCVVAASEDHLRGTVPAGDDVLGHVALEGWRRGVRRAHNLLVLHVVPHHPHGDVVVEDARQAEVGDLHHQRVRVDQDVRRLKVAMDDAGAVHELYPLAELEHDSLDLVFG